MSLMKYESDEIWVWWNIILMKYDSDEILAYD